jgi:prepilin signal peptidase PulO-like enzyme (type II secretory pathway)
MTAQLFNTLLTGTLGACWGSFLNSAFYREENAISLSKPPSHCPNCKKNIPLYSNVPIIGWAFTGGKCFNCKKPISIHYPAVELLTAIAFMLCLLLAPSAAAACCLGAVLSLLVLGTVFDHKHFVIPNVTIVGAALFAFALVMVNPQVTYPGLPDDQDSRAMMAAGGVGLAVLLLFVKFTAQLFYQRTEDFGGTMLINDKGVKSTYPNGEKYFTPWSEFYYQQVIPKGAVKVLKALSLYGSRPEQKIDIGAQSVPVEVSDEAVCINDEKVIINEILMDLKHGVEVQSEKLYTCRSVMGMGDIKLALGLGMLVGLNAGLFRLLFVASIIGILYWLCLRRQDHRLPLAPSLMVATVYVIAVRHGILPDFIYCIWKIAHPHAA